jgi:hypothetical protein
VKFFAHFAALILGVPAALALALPAVAQPVPLHTPTTAPYTTTVGAHARFSKARINLAQPDLALATALVRAGGGAAAFDADTFIAALTGNGPLTQTETASLTKRFGADNVASFVETFHFFVSDALTQATAAGIALPATPVPDPADAKAFATALYAAGAPPRGTFDVEYMLDSLVSHVIHVAVMNDIDADPDLGPKADANFHAILSRFMFDLKSAYNLST